jgi:hypothetical protein
VDSKKETASSLDGLLVVGGGGQTISRVVLSLFTRYVKKTICFLLKEMEVTKLTLTPRCTRDEAERVIASIISKDTEAAGSTVKLEPEKLFIFSRKVKGSRNTVNLIKSVTLC